MRGTLKAASERRLWGGWGSDPSDLGRGSSACREVSSETPVPGREAGEASGLAAGSRVHSSPHAASHPRMARSWVAGTPVCSRVRSSEWLSARPSSLSANRGFGRPGVLPGLTHPSGVRVSVSFLQQTSFPFPSRSPLGKPWLLGLSPPCRGR